MKKIISFHKVDDEYKQIGNVAASISWRVTLLMLVVITTYYFFKDGAIPPLIQGIVDVQLVSYAGAYYFIAKKKDRLTT